MQEIPIRFFVAEEPPDKEDIVILCDNINYIRYFKTYGRRTPLCNIEAYPLDITALCSTESLNVYVDTETDLKLSDIDYILHRARFKISKDNPLNIYFKKS